MKKDALKDGLMKTLYAPIDRARSEEDIGIGLDPIFEKFSKSVPEENKKDINEIKQRYLTGLKFHYVEDMMDVLKKSLLKEKVKKPIDI